MFKWNRIVVALVGIPLLVFIYTNMAFKGLPLLIFSLFVVGVGLNEFYNMIIFSGKEVYKKIGIITGLLVVLLTYYDSIKTYYLLGSEQINPSKFMLSFFIEKFNLSVFNLLILIVIILLIYRVLKNKIKRSLESVSYTIFGVIYVAIFFSQIINLYFTDYKHYQISGIAPKITMIMILQILVWVSDTAAGSVGVTIGRRFFKNGFTEISPKKSVEGAIGSLIFTGLASVILTMIMANFSFGSISIIKSFIVGVILSVVAQIGDLIESLFKRECGVKDSGTILMGHGGILDRFDSMLLVLPVFSYLISLL